MRDIRYTTMSGIYEFGDKNAPVVLTFSEWWNGEGIDFVFERGGERRMSVTIEEAHALVTMLIATGFVDVTAAQTEADQMILESKRRDRAIKDIRSLAGLTGDEC